MKGKAEAGKKWVKGKVDAGVGAVKAKLSGDRRTADEKQRDLDAGLNAADALVAEKLPENQIKARLPQIKTMYKMSSLSLVVDAETESEETVHVVGAVNPGGSRTQKTIPKRPDPYDPAPRTIAQVWNDCLLKNRFHGSETPAEAADRVLKAKHRLVAEGRLLPNLDAVLAHDGGLSPRPFVSVVNEDALRRPHRPQARPRRRGGRGRGRARYPGPARHPTTPSS